MQITFDTANPHDLNILNRLLNLACTQDAQPAVAQNTGTSASGVSHLSPEGSGVSEQGAADAAPAAPEKKRGRKPKAENPVVVKTGEEWIGAAKAVEELNAEVSEEAAAAEEPEAPVVQETADPATFTIDEVRAALQQFTAAKGVPAGIELLKKFGAGRISELAEGDYASFVAECSL